MEKNIILTFFLLHILNVLGVRISQEICHNYEKMFPSISDDTTALRDEVAPREFPFMAKVYDGKSNSYYNGILISENFVLSLSYTLLSEDQSYAVFEDYVNKRDIQPQRFTITQIIKHLDLSLLKMNSSVNFNKYVRPVCLSQPESVFSQQYTQIGWGVRSMLRKEKLDFILNSTCNESLRKYVVDGQMFCASTEKGHTCENFFEIIEVEDLYSSGSALLNRREMSSYNEIVGVKTVNDINCQSGNPEDYIRVSAYLDWIENNVWLSKHNNWANGNEKITLCGNIKAFIVFTCIIHTFTYLMIL